MFFPLYILVYNRQQVITGLHKQNDNDKVGKQANIKHTFFGKAGIKVTTICDLILTFFFSNTVPLIGADCPSQSRDAILVAVEISSASAGPRAHNVAATFYQRLS